MSGDHFIELPVRGFPLLSRVRLYRETVTKVMIFHPEIPVELPSIEAAIRKAIAEPSYVATSYGSSYVFVDEGSTNRTGLPLLVAVKVLQERSGRVRSFYFARPPDAHRIIWRQEP